MIPGKRALPENKTIRRVLDLGVLKNEVWDAAMAGICQRAASVFEAALFPRKKF